MAMEGGSLSAAAYVGLACEWNRSLGYMTPRVDLNLCENATGGPAWLACEVAAGEASGPPLSCPVMRFSGNVYPVFAMAA